LQQSAAPPTSKLANVSGWLENRLVCYLLEWELRAPSLCCVHLTSLQNNQPRKPGTAASSKQQCSNAKSRFSTDMGIIKATTSWIL
jgi:hypothetical protein